MTARGALVRHVLRTRDPASCLAFYEALGMQGAVQGDGALVLRFAGEDDAPELELRPDADAHIPDPARRHGYWKIGVTTPNVDALRAKLVAAGADVSTPAQFEDIGYLCHTRDPGGHAIELLQHRFGPPAADAPLTPLRLGQITLRVRDADASLAFYERELGMQRLSRQRVDRLGFTLWFLGARPEALPEDDLDAVSNREWLWQRAQPLLELQHYDRPGPPPPPAHADEAETFVGLGFRRDDGATADDLLDPDGYRISFVR